MKKIALATNVVEESLKRLEELYALGHRLVISFSSGKDSTVLLELAIIAAKKTNRLPVEVIMRDEEILFPHSFEFAEQTANRDEIDFKWILIDEPIINVFCRENPYWYPFDRRKKELWVRNPPSNCIYLKDAKSLGDITNVKRYPIIDNQKLFQVIGIRTSESRRRNIALSQSRGFLSKNSYKNTGAYSCKPIYDWDDLDIWKAISQFKWNYNHAYNVLLRYGIPNKQLRVSPLTIHKKAIRDIIIASKLPEYQDWYLKVKTRIKGIDEIEKFGDKILLPIKHPNETWENYYKREILNCDIQWIKERGEYAMIKSLESHGNHSSDKFPDKEHCKLCGTNNGSWYDLSRLLYSGDPFNFSGVLKKLSPEFFYHF